MLTEDYFLRQIAQAAAVVAKVLGLSKAGQFQEAYKVIDQAIEELLGLKTSIAKQMDDTGLVSLLTTINGVDPGRLFALADIFKAEGDVLANQNRRDESHYSYQRALILYLEFSARYPDTLETDLSLKINELREKLNMQG